MKYGISFQRLPQRAYDRIIIPGLAPTQIMSLISLGMGRPDWIKYIISAVAHQKLDLSSPIDRNNMIFNEDWGLLLQTFIWKRDAWEREENFTGYGIGSLQLQNSGTLGILAPNISWDALCFDIVNDIMYSLKEENVKQIVKDLEAYFKYTPEPLAISQRLASIINKPLEERKKSIFSLFVWIIDNAISKDYPAIDGKAGVFSVANQFIRIVEDLGASNHENISRIQRLLCSEKPPEIKRGLTKLEVAALIYDVLQTERTSAIALSFALYDLIRSNSPTATTNEMDLLLREAYRRLQSSDVIQDYIDKLYARITSSLSRHLQSTALMSYYDFTNLINPSKVKRVAVLWEYSLIAGELEEMLRRFISEDYQTPPYNFSFSEKYDNMLKESSQYWQDIISKFEELAINVLNDPTYFIAFRSEKEEESFLDIPSWFKTVSDGLSSRYTLRDKFEGLFKVASQVGISIKYQEDKVTVLKSPSPTHPLIARDAFYQWLRTLEGIWEP